jgi:thioredoxin-related protein
VRKYFVKYRILTYRMSKIKKIMDLRKILTFQILFFLTISVLGQEDVKIYNPNADAKKNLETAIIKATDENKHIFVQIGGNWCPWCVLMHEFYTQDSEIDSIINTDYVSVLLNFSRENKNSDILEQFNYPQRFGFPVIVILDSDGELLHTQNTLYLEEDKGYNRKIFIDFLKNWNKQAINPENYKK